MSWLKNNKTSCNVCGASNFVDMGTRRNAKCGKCGSLERTRAMKLYLDKVKASLAGCKVLHLAPEKGLAEYLIAEVGVENYLAVDIAPENFNFCDVKKLDLCKDLKTFESLSFDVIIHSHVIEHVPCNYSIVLQELHRCLKNDGVHLCCIPFMSGHYEEDCSDVSEEERIRRFGQGDHIRKFGDKDVNNSIGMIFDINLVYDLENDFHKDILSRHNIPDYARKGYNPSSILALRKNDLKIG